MTCAAARFSGVSAFDRGVSARADDCRVIGPGIGLGVGIGLGTVTTGRLAACAVSLAVAWGVATTFGAGSPERTALSPPPAAERDKGPRLEAPFPRTRELEYEDALTATAPVLPSAIAAPPSGFVAAAFDLFDPEPTWLASLSGAVSGTPQPPTHRLAQTEDAPRLHRTAARHAPALREIADARPQSAPLPLAAAPPAPASGLFASLKRLFVSRPSPGASIAAAVPGADSHTAVYDIAARTVYLPDGAQLEAHSGLGAMLDDPHYVETKGRGPTPPNVYDLVLRDRPFHGVEAIRLKPVGDAKMYGRDGLLAHSYMLGPTGQSFGCVSFKDYPKFLDAFLKGEVERLVVVPHLEPVISAQGRPSGGQHQEYAVND